MKCNFKKYNKSTAAAMVEAGLLAALIAVAGIVSLRTLGEKIEHTYCVKIAGELGNSAGGGVNPENPCMGNTVVNNGGNR